MGRETGGKLDKLFVRGAIAIGSAAVGMVVAEAIATNLDLRDKSTKAEVYSHIRPGEYATFTVPGYHSNGYVIGKNLDRHFEQLGTTHYAAHPQRGFSLDSMREEWLKARQLDGHRPARIYALSMGGLLVSKLFSDDNFREEFGPVDRIVLDSSLSGKSDLSMSEKLAMGVATVLPATYTANQIYRFISRSEVGDELDYEESVLLDEVVEHLESKAKVHYSAGRDQVMFMRHEDVSRIDLSKFGASVMQNIIYVASNDDKVVNTDHSVQVYSNSLDKEIQYRIDPLRKLNTAHAGGPERPASAIDALLDINHHRYDISPVSPKK